MLPRVCMCECAQIVCPAALEMVRLQSQVPGERNAQQPFRSRLHGGPLAVEEKCPLRHYLFDEEEDRLPQYSAEGLAGHGVDVKPFTAQ